MHAQVKFSAIGIPTSRQKIVLRNASIEVGGLPTRSVIAYPDIESKVSPWKTVSTQLKSTGIPEFYFFKVMAIFCAELKSLT